MVNERIKELEIEIARLEPIVDEQMMRQSRAEPTSLEFDELERKRKELTRLKALQRKDD